jgi:hypothetical protein
VSLGQSAAPAGPGAARRSHFGRRSFCLGERTLLLVERTLLLVRLGDQIVMRLSGSILGDEIVIGLSHLAPPLIGPRNGFRKSGVPVSRVATRPVSIVHESYGTAKSVTKAGFLGKKGTKTDVFNRYSTVLGFAGFGRHGP